MKNVYERYGYYLKYIRELGGLPLSAKVTPKSLGIDDRTAQMAWRESKESGLRMSFVPYIAFVSSYYLFECWADRVLKEPVEQMDVDKAQRIFIELAKQQHTDTRNTLRSFPNLPIVNIQPGWSEKLDALAATKLYEGVVGRLVATIKIMIRHREIDEIRATERTVEYQAHNRDSEPSFQTVSADSPSLSPSIPSPSSHSQSSAIIPPSSPLTSRASKEAERSGASSRKAPSGASIAPKGVSKQTPPGLVSKVESIEASIRQKNAIAVKMVNRSRKAKKVAVPLDPVQLTKPSSGDTGKRAPKDH